MAEASPPFDGPKPTFFSSGNGRWFALVGAVVLVGLLVVTLDGKQLDQLREQDLVGAAAPAKSVSSALRREDSIRAALARGRAPRVWGDDMQSVAQGRAAAQLGLSRAKAASPSWSIFGASASSAEQHEAKCTRDCDTNGYSSREAGPAAARACVDVCVSEATHRAGVAPAGASAQPRPASSAAPRRGRHLPHTPAVGLAEEGASLSSFLRSRGVSASKLPAKDAALLKRSVAVDESLRERAARGRDAMHAMWGEGVKDMARDEAARLENADSVATATARALAGNREEVQADSRLLRAASAYHGATALPVDLAKARKQLSDARGREQAMREAAAVAAGIARQERVARSGGMLHAQAVLAAPSWAQRAGGAGVRGWTREAKAAAEMPGGAAKAVRESVMAEGRLVGIEKGLYDRTRGGEERLARDVRREHEARVASARLLEGSLAHDASDEAKKGQLSAAKAAYLGKVSRIEGPGASPGGARALEAGAAREAAEARGLAVAAGATEGMLRAMGARAGGGGTAQLEEAVRAGEGTGRAAPAVRPAPAAAHAPVADFVVGGPSAGAAHAHRGAPAALGGASAVKDAGKGWFSLSGLW